MLNLDRGETLLTARWSISRRNYFSLPYSSYSEVTYWWLHWTLLNGIRRLRSQTEVCTYTWNLRIMWTIEIATDRNDAVVNVSFRKRIQGSLGHRGTTEETADKLVISRPWSSSKLVTLTLIPPIDNTQLSSISFCNLLMNIIIQHLNYKVTNIHKKINSKHE